MNYNWRLFELVPAYSSTFESVFYCRIDVGFLNGRCSYNRGLNFNCFIYLQLQKFSLIPYLRRCYPDMAFSKLGRPIDIHLLLAKEYLPFSSSLLCDALLGHLLGVYLPFLRLLLDLRHYL